MTRLSTINRTTKSILVLFGIWPSTPYVMICRMYWIITLSTDELLLHRYFLTHFHSSELFVLMDCLNSILAHGKLFAKVIIFWLNQRKFVKILALMADDWRDCINCDTEKHIIENKAKLSDRITTAIFILHVLAISVYSIGVLSIDTDVNDRESELPLFLKLMMIGIGVGMLNSLLLTLIIHVGGQVDILRSWLSKLVPKDDKRTPESITIMTNKIIRKHQKIIDFSEYIEELYTHIALVLFTSNTVLICTLAFLIVTALGSSNATEMIVRSLLFYTITNLEAFIFCFAGEYLKNKSNAIGIAAYNSAWYKLKPEESRTLLFVILRAQKQLTLTAGKMMDLTLESFMNIMKASGSYLSVLLAMQ